MRPRELRLVVAEEATACAADECARVVPAGDVLHLRRVEGTACSEPLCPEHAAGAVEDMKLLARIAIHGREQAARLVPEPAPKPSFGVRSF